jgi:hypothetical protein
VSRCPISSPLPNLRGSEGEKRRLDSDSALDTGLLKLKMDDSNVKKRGISSGNLPGGPAKKVRIEADPLSPSSVDFDAQSLLLEVANSRKATQAEYEEWKAIFVKEKIWTLRDVADFLTDPRTNANMPFSVKTDLAKLAKESRTNLVRPTEENVLESDASPDLFNQYQSVKNSLEKHLYDMMNPLLFSNFRHYVLFLQSSGYGKTRLCLNLLKKMFGIYLLCDNITGGFCKSQLIDTLVTEFQAAPEVGRQRCVVKLLKRLEDYSRKFKSPEELFAQQFDEDGKMYRSSFTDPYGTLGEPPNPHSTAALTEKAIQDANSTGPDSATNDQSKALPSASSAATTSGNWLIIVFDEAHKLGESLIEKLKLALDQFRMIGIFLTTCGHVDELVTSKSSYRGSGLTCPPILCQLESTDLYRTHRLTLGRPLWYHYLNSSRCSEAKNPYNELVRYALLRLSGGSTQAQPPIDTTAFYVSLFMCRFGGLYPADYSKSSDFVVKHLATYGSMEVTEVHGARKVICRVAYPSEPLLAETSALCTSAILGTANVVRCTKEMVLRTVSDQVLRSSGIVKLNKGDLGELFACALVGYQLDLLREKYLLDQNIQYDAGIEKNSMSSPVSVKDFVCALHAPTANMPELALFDGYTLNTTHFVRLPYKTAYSTCAKAIERGAGIITYENSRVLDFFMEAVRHGQEDSAVHVHSEDAAEYEDTSTSLSVGAYNGHKVYQDAGGHYYLAVGKQLYLSAADAAKIDCTQDEQNLSGAMAADQEAEPEARRHDNMHIRISVKNYAKDITRAEAEEMLNAIDTECEPVHAVGGGIVEGIRLSILLNVGAGVLEPFAMKSIPRITRNRPRKDSQVHLMVAVGLNFERHVGTLTPRPFAYFSDDCLNLFRAAAPVNSTAKEAEMAMMLGKDFYSDRDGCLHHRQVK